MKTMPVIVRENLLKDWPNAIFTVNSFDNKTIPSFAITGGTMTLTGAAGVTDQRVATVVTLPAGFGSKVTVGLDYTGPTLASMGLADGLLRVIAVGPDGLYSPVATLQAPATVTPGHYRLDAVLPDKATQVEMRIGVFTTTPFTVTRLAIMRTSEYIE
ncbi:hypothetical protein GFD21_10210 [Bifidobacterium sp. SMA15]|uniref:Uncharacterized protein n=1 Tax=Bifidobacterium platyrrhinorum TaxID=2661628 RepID=A0A6L9SVE9_9BIFI|nr:hypothetical protein [Bifidobacterium platyrrhinorum]